jgi:hypothetical protein
MKQIPYVKQIIEMLEKLDVSDEQFIKQIYILIHNHIQKKGAS